MRWIATVVRGEGLYLEWYDALGLICKYILLKSVPEPIIGDFSGRRLVYTDGRWRVREFVL